MSICRKHARRFEDSRGWCCAAYNEVAIDYNAAFTGALARLVDYYADVTPASDCGLELGWSHPNATQVRVTVIYEAHAGISSCFLNRPNINICDLITSCNTLNGRCAHTRASACQSCWLSCCPAVETLVRAGEV